MESLNFSIVSWSFDSVLDVFNLIFITLFSKLLVDFAALIGSNSEDWKWRGIDDVPKKVYSIRSCAAVIDLGKAVSGVVVNS